MRRSCISPALASVGLTYSFSNLNRLFFGSFIFATTGNVAVSILTYLYVVIYRVGYELNPIMIIEARILGTWLIPAHVISITAYYVLFYFTIRRYVLTRTRFMLWIAVLVVIPALSACDLAFDVSSIIRI